MSTRSSILYASNETVSVHVFHELMAADPDAYFLEITGKDKWTDSTPAHFCVRLPRNVAFALHNWIFAAKIAADALKKAGTE